MKKKVTKKSNSSSSIYNGVTWDKDFEDFESNKPWKTLIKVKGVTVHVSHHRTEREAAIAADKVYISIDKMDKVNILKPKS